MQIVAIYIRVSKKEQAKRGVESSLSLQLKKCTDHCNEKGYKILKVYQDVESGGHDDREGFVELQKQLNKKIFTKIVFWEISRIARITSTGMKFFESLDKYGITFDSISQPFIKDVMTLGIFLSIAAQERIQLSERVKSNSLERTKMGFFVRGVPPKGYKRSEENSKLIVPDPKNAPMILRIFETYSQTGNLTETGRQFGKTKNEIVSIIDNRIYIGEVVHGKYKGNLYTKYREQKKGQETWYKGLHEPIVPKELFDYCQKLREANFRTREAYVNDKPYLLFSGSVSCTCGSKMFQQKRKRTHEGKEYNYYSYSCSNRACRKSFSSIKLDSAIKNFLINSEYLKKINEIKTNFNYDNEKEKIEKDIKKLMDEKERTITLYQKGFIDDERLENQFKDIKNKTENLNLKLHSLKSVKESDDVIENFEKLTYIIENYSEQDIIETRVILKLLIKEISIISFKPLEFSIIFR